jgi:hypothetical protein
MSVLAFQANADIILQTALFTGVDTGEYIVHSDRFIGASFVLSSPAQTPASADNSAVSRTEPFLEQSSRSTP